MRILEPDVRTAGPMGRMVITVLGMVAEMELGFIKERQAAGIAKAKKAGVYKGRPASIDAELVRKLTDKGMGPSAIAKQMGIGRASVYRVLGGASS